MISIDCETTGKDLYHGARPFLVTTCDEDGNNTWFEWDVDPLTRKPEIPRDDLFEIEGMLDKGFLVLQNPRFDVRALYTIDIDGEWNWEKTYDTLLAGHLLASNQPHDLTTMALIYLGVGIKKYEDAIEKACREARRIAGTSYPDWRIAKKGLPEMPSAKEKVWKFDMWLPRAIAKEEGYSQGHPWWTVCSEYANVDSTVTLPLFKKQRDLLKERGLWKIYLERLKILPVAYAMEDRGITISGSRLEELTEDYREVADKCHRICITLADGEIEKLPVSGVSNALKHVIFDKFGLVSTKKTEKGNPSMDKSVLDDWLLDLPEHGRPHAFIKNLKAYRKRKTAITYMDGYKRFWIHRRDRNGDGHVLHPSLNPTGTNTLRWSSSNPNEQNISKKEGFNLRYCFGPAPGREWWSLDAENIELRIPAYEAGEEEMVNLFEKRDEPPYYGSYHLLIFDTLHPKEFSKHGVECKKIYGSTLYQWTKNGNFALQYGAVESSGTADRAYHVPGAQRRIQRRFGKIAELNRKMIKQAERHGYVETMPDKTVDPLQGYPLLCTRSKWGGVLPTVPLSYHVSGTAMWWMAKGMVRCQKYLNRLNARCTKPEFFMVMQVHDELVFDFPRHPNEMGHISKVRKIRSLMEQGGKDIGVPTPVNIEYSPETWNEGVVV